MQKYPACVMNKRVNPNDNIESVSGTRWSSISKFLQKYGLLSMFHTIFHFESTLSVLAHFKSLFANFYIRFYHNLSISYCKLLFIAFIANVRVCYFTQTFEMCTKWISTTHNFSLKWILIDKIITKLKSAAQFAFIKLQRNSLAITSNDKSILATL